MQLISVLILSFILRLVSLGQSFWLDEAIGVLAAKNQSWLNLLTQWPKGDNHPPLYYLMLKGWGDTFGYSEIAIKLLSVLFGVLTVFFVYKLAQEFVKDRKKPSFLPIFSALLVATSPLHIYFSQEARMYIVSSALAVGAVWFFVRTIKKINLWNFIGFSVFLTLLSFSDYLPATMLLFFWIYAVVVVRKKAWWTLFVLAHLPLAVLGYFWLPIYKVQSQAGAVFLATLPAWKDLAGGASIKQLVLVWTKFTLGRISYFNKVLYYSLLGVVSVPFLATLIISAKKYKRVILFWLWLITPLFFGFIISFFVPAFNYFRFLFVLPAFYLLLAWGIGVTKSRLGNVLAILLVLINLLGWGLYALNPNQHRENWRGAVAFVEENNSSSSVVVFANPEPFAPYQWYSKGSVLAVGLLDSVKIDESKVITKTINTVQGKSTVIYFDYLSSLMDPEGIIKQVIIRQGFNPESEHSFVGVGKITYFERSE